MLHGDLKEVRRRVGYFRYLLGRPMSIDSILDGLRDISLAVIQDEMSEIVSRS